MTTELIAAELARLAHDGRLTPNDVVEAARNPASPLHEHFEWADDVAAHAWRLQQARALIRTVTITVTASPGATLVAPNWIRDPASKPEDQGYISVAKLRTEEELAREAIISEFSRAAAALNRARAIAKALGMEAEIDSIVSQITDLSRRVMPAEVSAPSAN